MPEPREMEKSRKTAGLSWAECKRRNMALKRGDYRGKGKTRKYCGKTSELSREGNNRGDFTGKRLVFNEIGITE